MYRKAIEKLWKWKDDPKRKPLIIQGARQVGKTWLAKEFGKQAYEKTVYVNFDSNLRMQELFSGDFNIERIIKGLELNYNMQIDEDRTLLIFDEVQEVPRALLSLKYFYEEAPRYNIICAGSLLGIALHEGTSFPVGKVDFLKLYPLSFYEFLLACDKENFVDLLNANDYAMISVFKQDFVDLLKYYYFVGGMPEAVASFIKDRDFNKVKTIQTQILSAYEQDFSKHAPTNVVPKIRMIWNSIPSQLAKENKKFLYGKLKEGGRAKEFEDAILWLCDCGLINKISRVNAGKLPLKAYEDLKTFKIYLLDVGLLSCMCGINAETLLDGNDLFLEFKGSLTEQYVLCELISQIEYNIYYYTNDNSTCEVDFVIDCGDKIIPIEVKAEVNLKSKSLKTFMEKFNLKKALRTSMKDYMEQDPLTNLPLYAIGNIEQVIKKIITDYANMK